MGALSVLRIVMWARGTSLSLKFLLFSLKWHQPFLRAVRCLARERYKAHITDFPSRRLQCRTQFKVCHACSLLLSDCKRIQQLDVVFIRLDHSGSINAEDQENMINLTIHLVKKSDVGLTARFGALRYSDDPEVLSTQQVLEWTSHHRASEEA